MLNLASPAAAARRWRLPADGVGLVGMAFVIANVLRVHPLALTRYDRVRDPAVRAEIDRLTRSPPTGPTISWRASRAACRGSRRSTIPGR
jgi:pyruvate,water dikinase